MSYELSFSPEFFLAEGEPYDRSDDATNRKGQAVSVWTAIAHFKQHEPNRWREMASELWGLRGRHRDLLMAEAVLDKIRETNTCSNLNTPVEVWIDPEGIYRVKVWDER